MIKKPVTLSLARRKTRGKRVRCHLSRRVNALLSSSVMKERIVKREEMSFLVHVFWWKVEKLQVHVRKAWRKERVVVMSLRREDMEGWKRKSRVMFVLERKLANSIVPNGRGKGFSPSLRNGT